MTDLAPALYPDELLADATEAIDAEAEACPPDRNPKTCLKASQLIGRVGDKWTVLIIMFLRERGRRFSELKRGIDGISQRMLTLTLRKMERDGLVTRTVLPSIPPRVDYKLTPMGHSLADPVQALGAWAFEHLEKIGEAQAEYDAREAERTW